VTTTSKRHAISKEPQPSADKSKATTKNGWKSSRQSLAKLPVQNYQLSDSWEKNPFLTTMARKRLFANLATSELLLGRQVMVLAFTSPIKKPRSQSGASSLIKAG